jgi:ferrochelatase
MKTAVVLMNLGGPLKEADIEPFLYNFFTDKNIIALPSLLRNFVARRIAKKRSQGAARDVYARLGFKSPLLENTQKQANALEKKLGEGFRVFVSMRYWHPMAKEVIAQLEEYKPDNLVLLPLYPQFSTATVKSSLEDFWANVQDDGGWLHANRDYPVKIHSVCCYPLDDGFVKASADNIRQALEKAPPKTRVLFSAHGLPEKTVRGGDPYRWQGEKTAEAVAKEAGLADWQICYQSRVGPLKWIGPSTEEALQKAANDKVGVILYPHTFVSEHVETLVEIDIDYREKARHMGIPYFGKVETVGTHESFIGGLAEIVKSRLQGKPCARVCPAQFKKCGCKGKG